MLADTVTPPLQALRDRGQTHWSARRLAAWLARHCGIIVSHDSIVWLWRRFCLAPHRTEGVQVLTDPSWRRRSATWSAAPTAKSPANWCSAKRPSACTCPTY
jgi:hypothetical protein